MTATVGVKARSSHLGIFKSVLVSLPMLLFSAFLLFGSMMGQQDTLLLLAAALVWLGVNAVFFLMVYTGYTHRYRSALFIAISIGFVIFFITNLLETRGSMVLTEENMARGETPFCHLAIPSIVIPAVLTRTIVFPGSMLQGFASIASMLVIWVGSSLALGRGWCSWACFYGGLDEGFSRLARKPLIKRIDRKWTYLPYAVLLFVVLLSALTLSPAYCEWLCPFKAVTEFPAVTSALILIQTIIFVALFVGLVVVLPILTRRRIQCGLFCPLGALQSLTNKINVFEVRIDPDKCIRCKRCLTACPTFSLDEGSLESGKPLLSCTKCGQCVDLCPKQAISYHVKGTPLHVRPNLARMLFLYPAFLLMVTFNSGMLSVAVWRILKLVTTGSMF